MTDNESTTIPAGQRWGQRLFTTGEQAYDSDTLAASLTNQTAAAMQWLHSNPPPKDLELRVSVSLRYVNPDSEYFYNQEETP